jgi:peptidoglycan/xylan/chitin deacetylase (PgdA/CDA1 family)
VSIFSVDVEEWHAPLSHRGIAISADQQRDLHPEIEKILALLKEFKHGATFFILGSYARQHPKTVRLISESGFEIGSHYDEHVRIDGLSRDELKNGVASGVSTIEELIGSKVLGFRAPFFSWNDHLPDILKELGLVYDSSTLPGFSFLGGRRTRSRAPHRLDNGIIEVPVSTFMGFPISGISYLKMLPFGLVRFLIPKDYVLYLHPRETCQDLPRLNVSLKLRTLLYARQDRTLPLLRGLSGLRQFQSMEASLRSSGFIS